MSDMKAGRELDALVAEKVMGRDMTKPEGFKYPIGLPRYSVEIAEAWKVVWEVQRQHPGWRFCLLGGDVSMGYKRDPAGGWVSPLVVVEDSREAFGWDASFFGELDPRVNCGDRHGEAWADTAPLAICLAALQAVESGRPLRSGSPEGT